MKPAKAKPRWIKTMMLFSALFLFAFAPLSIAVSAASEDMRSVEGVIDLSADRSAAGKQYIPLQGQWEFYWNELLEPGDFAAKASLPEAAYLEVPSLWGEQQTDSSAEQSTELEVAKYGFGTYRLQIKLPGSDVGRSKALYIRPVGSAYRIWVDGQESPGLGTVGTSRAEEIPQVYANLIFFEPDRSTMEIVIQVSNFSFREGGVISEIAYGDAAALNTHMNKTTYADLFIAGGFALIGVYHLLVYGFRQKNLPTLLLGIATLMMSARTLLMNGYLTMHVLDLNRWELLVKLEYLAENIGFLFFVLLIKNLFPREVHRYALNAACGLVAALSAFVVLTPARIFTETMLEQTAAKAVILVYFICYVGILAFLRKREGALINLSAVLVIFAAIVNDMLYHARLIGTVELINYSAVAFLLAQAVLVSYRYARLVRKNDALVAELGEMNESLEKRVRARTEKLREANERLSEMKEVRTKMLVNIAHDLNSPLAGVQTYLQLMGREAPMIDRPSVVKQLILKTVYIQRLIHELFELAKLESREQTFEWSRESASDWLESVYKQFAEEFAYEETELRRGRWECGNEEEELHVRVDRYRMLQVFNNYMDNAIKFSRGRSAVITMHVYAERQSADGKGRLMVEIEDRGEGIPEEELPLVFSRLYKKRTDNEEGSGLGLAIAAQIIEQHGGEVGARSVPGEGSVFYFTLPLAE